MSELVLHLREPLLNPDPFLTGQSVHCCAEDQVCKGSNALPQQACQNEQEKAQKHHWTGHGQGQKAHQRASQEKAGSKQGEFINLEAGVPPHSYALLSRALKSCLDNILRAYQLFLQQSAISFDAVSSTL